MTFQALPATLGASGIVPRGGGDEVVVAGNPEAPAGELRPRGARAPLDPAHPAERPRCMIEVGARFTTPAIAGLAGAAGGGGPRVAMISNPIPDPGAMGPGPVESSNVDEVYP
jgi:hypothetical protein